LSIFFWLSWPILQVKAHSSTKLDYLNFDREIFKSVFLSASIIFLKNLIQYTTKANWMKNLCLNTNFETKLISYVMFNSDLNLIVVFIDSCQRIFLGCTFGVKLWPIWKVEYNIMPILHLLNTERFTVLGKLNFPIGVRF